VIGKKISHYTILEKIGEGGMGVIYRAEDTKLRREVALKFLPHNLTGSDEDRSRFHNEARAASALNHPNITTIYEIDEVGEDTFIAMEYLIGGTLKDSIANEKKSTRNIIEVGESISEALSAAHNLEIVHRDIKSENIMILKSGTVKIMDFGLAKRKGDNLITKKGVTMGTVAYMSPEQVEGKLVDYRTDIFSLGVILYEMATGSLPFKGEHEASILYSIVNETPTLPSKLNSSIHPELERIILRALEKKAENRYQSAATLVSEFDTLKNNIDSKQFLTKTIVPEHVSEEIIPTKPKTRTKRKALIISSAILVLVVLSYIYNDLVQYVPLLIKADVRSENQAQRENDNSLAVLYFDNLQDPDDTQRLGQILQELVIADLSEMTSLKVFSSRRLFDIQKQLGSDSRRLIDPDLATEIAKRAGAKRMLTGKVMQVGDKTILTSQLIDTYDGSIIESQRVEGTDIYVLVDELVHQIQIELNVGQDDQLVASQSVKEKTSSSMSAYQHYLEGMDHFNDSHFEQAADKFRQAIAMDSTFTRAYYELSMSLWWYSSLEGGMEARNEAKIILDRVVNGGAKLSTKDRLLFSAASYLLQDEFQKAEETYTQLVTLLPDEKDAWFGLGEAAFHGSHDQEVILNALEQVLKLDPEFSLAYRHIFDVYKEQKAFTRGVVRANQYVSINPDDPWGHVFMADMLIARENYDKAFESLEKAIDLDPSSSTAASLLVKLAQTKNGLEDRVENLLEGTLDKHPEIESLYLNLAKIYKMNNKARESSNIINRGLDIAPENVPLINMVVNAYIYDGDALSALSLIEEKINLNISRKFTSQMKRVKSSVLAQLGRYHEAITEFNDLAENYGDINQELYSSSKLASAAWYAIGLGNADSGIVVLDRFLEVEENTLDRGRYLYVKAMIHFYKKDRENFITTIENISDPMFKKFTENYKTASLALLDNDLDRASESIDSLSFKEFFDYSLAYELTLNFIDSGSLEKANKYLTLLSNKVMDIYSGSVYKARLFYLKGRLYEAQGDGSSAIKAYQDLLDIWIEADPEIPELSDIYRRLVKLRRYEQNE